MVKGIKIAVDDDEITDLKTSLKRSYNRLFVDGNKSSVALNDSQQASSNDNGKKNHMKEFDEGFRGKWAYGTDYNKLKEIVEYWINEYDWKKYENVLNSFSNFTASIPFPKSKDSKINTNLKGKSLNIHFIHEKSTLQNGDVNPNAIPILLVHGWPGSVYEFVKVIPRLVVKNGDSKTNCFHAVVPSLPGFGFSEIPSGPGMSPHVIAEMLHQLMVSLGYKHYAIQGGDWGSIICRAMAVSHPEAVAALHVNMPIGFPAFFGTSLHTILFRIKAAIDLSPLQHFTLSEQEIQRVERVKNYATTDISYFIQHGMKPNTLGYALEDSPVGLLSWILEKFQSWTDCNGDVLNSLSKDDILTSICIYWFTRTATSSSRIYYEYLQPNLDGIRELFNGPEYVDVPTGVASFPKEIIGSPKGWCEMAFNLKHHSLFKSGGHFAAWEQPEVFADDVKKFLFQSTNWKDNIEQAKQRELKKKADEEWDKKFGGITGYLPTSFVGKAATAAGVVYIASKL